MHKFVILIILLYVLPFIVSENLVSLNADPFVVYIDSTTSILNFNITGYLNTQNYNVSCKFSGSDLVGYSNANFNSPTVTNPTVSIVLSNFVIGRNREFVCSLIYPNNIVTVTKYLSVRPSIQAFICGNISAVKDLSVTFSVRFTSPLDVDSSLSCSIGSPIPTTVIVSSNKISQEMNLVATSPASTIDCTFTRNAFISNFQGSIYLITPTIEFMPNSIITNSPIIKLTLVSNFNTSTPTNLNCTIVYPANISCPATSDSSINWTLSSNQATFSGSIDFVQLNMSRSGSIPSSVEKYAVVCCGYSSNVTVYIQINNTAMENNITTNGTATQYGDLRYTQLSSCPCDLTANSCDQNCCCDLFCNCTNIATTINGPYGGFFNDPLPRSCSYQDELVRQPYQSLLCVVNESPSILGDYYPMQDIINDVTTFASTLASSTRTSNVLIKIKDSSSLSQTTSLYIPINANYLYSFVPSKNLYLPRQVLDSSKCDLQNPIVLLQSFDSTCSYTVTKANCESVNDPRLTSNFYLTSTTITDMYCTANLSISSIQGNVPVFTFYKCFNGSSFINCNWDNGYNFPPTPAFNSNNCDNVVTSVVYTIYYNTSVVYIKANINLSNVSLNSTLDQKFVVSFVSTNKTKENASIQSVTTLESVSFTTASNISGRYGYDSGMPILTVNDTQNTNFVNMKTFSINPSGICTNNGNNVLFLQDSLVQCTYNLNSSICYDNRIAIKTYLDDLFPNNFVAVYGNPSLPSDYVSINTDTLNISNTVNYVYYPFVNVTVDQLKSIPINTMPEFCVNVTTGVTVTIYYTRQGKARNQYINNIVSVVKRYQLANVTNFVPIGANATSINTVTLTAYIEFVLVSANIIGNQSTDNVLQQVCLFDICLNELFYPWLYNYEGKQGFYEESFGLFLLGLGIYLLVTTYPWW